MKAAKIAVIVVVAYVGVVVAFESLIGVFQPADETTIVITTIDRDGIPHDRVVSRLESSGQLYVATNHWIRRWYNDALEQPEVRVTLNGGAGDYRVVPVTGAEHDRVAGENRLGVVLRFLTGFPPRYIVRLDPL
jgi:hypothetical protein